MRLRTLLLFLVLLIPSAFYAAKNADMPEFGKQHDDGLLFVSAKSLAEGEGFRILSLPEQPAQTKYPILYPLYLSLVWRINPHFPENLTVATWFSWPLLVLALALAWVFWRKEFSPAGEPHAWIIVALLAISPYMILFGCNVFSEMFFLCWVLAVFIASRQESVAMALLAGVLAGLAYLSRTAGIALIISMPAWYLWRRESRRAAAFAAGMLPFILGWAIWSAANKYPATNSTLLYYTDYVKFQFLNVDRSNFAIVVWKNIDALLSSFGSALIPQIFGMLPAKIITQVMGIAMISGIVRLARRGIGIPYALFALISSGMLVIWHYPPTERFVVPLYPVLAAGLVVELEHLVRLLRAAFRHNDRAQQAAAGAFAMGVLALLVGAIALELAISFNYMEGDARMDREKRAEMRSVYAWIEQRLPPSAGVLSNDDPLLYLYSGHQGNFATLLTRWWYAGDHSKIVGFYGDVVPYCRSRNFEYILATKSDMGRWNGGEDQPAVERAMRENSQLDPLYQTLDGVTIYHIR